MFSGEPATGGRHLRGLTMFSAFIGEYPHGNPTTPAKRKPADALEALRPDLSAWLQAALARTIAVPSADHAFQRAEAA